MESRCHHPSLGRPSPTFEELYATSDDDARALWDAARALAAWRVKRRAALQRLWDDYHDDPVEPAWSLRSRLDADEPGLGAVDLVRALVAAEHRLLEGVDLGDAPTRWRARLGEATELDAGEVSGALRYCWGRRWAWMRARAGDSELDVSTLLRSVPDRGWWALGRLSGRYREGLVTASEAYSSVVNTLGARGLMAGGVPSATWRRAPLAFDASAPGHALIGPPGSGKRTWLDGLRREFPGRGFNIDNFHGGGSPDPTFVPAGARAPSSTFASLSPGLVCAWTWAHNLEPELVSYATRMATSPAARFHLLIAATPEQWEEIRARSPETAALRVLAVEPLADEELLPIWLCQRPSLEDRTGRELELASLLPWLATIAGRGPASTASERLREALIGLDVTSREVSRTDRYAADSLPAELASIGWLRRAIRLEPARVWRRLTRRFHAWIEPLIPTPAHARALVELDAALSGTWREG